MFADKYLSIIISAPNGGYCDFNYSTITSIIEGWYTCMYISLCHFQDNTFGSISLGQKSNIPHIFVILLSGTEGPSVVIGVLNKGRL